MKIFKAEAEGDTLYIQAKNKKEAEERLETFCGELPPGMVHWTEGVKLPPGEELL